jgi:hypothetical protein
MDSSFIKNPKKKEKKILKIKKHWGIAQVFKKANREKNFQ